MLHAIWLGEITIRHGQVLGKSTPSLGNDCQEKRGVLTTGLDSSLIATISDRFTCGTGVGMSSTTIHWGRILLGGLLAEVALILAIVPLGLRLGDNFLHYTAPPGSFVMCFLGALWVCRRIESHFILHGTLVGVVAALIYVALTRAQPEPFAYIMAHALKLVGGASGGFVAQRRRSPSPPQPVHD
jgi:putative membrane protein (TIGR04086 family)